MTTDQELQRQVWQLFNENIHLSDAINTLLKAMRAMVEGRQYSLTEIAELLNHVASTAGTAATGNAIGRVQYKALTHQAQRLLSGLPESALAPDDYSAGYRQAVNDNAAALLRAAHEYLANHQEAV